ncbi:class I SAM-dependent methyltransferase [Amycolatopsis oliviviridis]|uniref:Methyltransferase n=1 Tax=Amycolatopsis oliviviridis TaxID=1471590 RepID=A0ABQ3L8C5_9PSEU|nr:class I SAM-dependent methyltransferase [Amycolatopsis oliviviridis]GHH01297.1 methyltransferase [Amycolatopsis oliviviridis]
MITDVRDTAGMRECRLCGQPVREFFDFGRQPVSDAFRDPADRSAEFHYDLAVGVCGGCAMVQQSHEVPRTRMFHADYPYRSSGSAFMRDHFEAFARRLLETELAVHDPFVVEIGSNDGVMLRTIAGAGVRHLGVEPSGGAADTARACGVRVLTEFFQEDSARRIRAEDGPADVIYSANTVSHIARLDSVFRGVDALLAPDGLFVVEDRYLGDIVDSTAFDQIYDEHFYLFSVESVCTVSRRFGFELVDITRLPVHGGTIRFTIARAGARPVAPVVGELLTAEHARGLADHGTLDRFAVRTRQARADLVGLLRWLRDEGRVVVGYGATAKSATVTNFCGIGPDLVPYICDSTPAKHGKLAPGSGIPVRPPAAFADPYPDYALLFAWNHAEEIMAKEHGFAAAGGRWIRYVPRVHIV